MSFNGFSKNDFQVFSVEGLDERMDALKDKIRPKLTDLGEHFTQYLSEKTGQDMYYHVAKHARRTVNPPKDTWVAFANNKRGYKMLPHFQIGLFETHLFVWFAVIYESPVKEKLGVAFSEQLDEIKKQVPKDFKWSVDHMKPDTLEHGQLSDDDLSDMFKRLHTVKKAEILCGITISSENELVQNGPELVKKIEKTFETVLPLYQLGMRVYENEM